MSPRSGSGPMAERAPAGPRAGAMGAACIGLSVPTMHHLRVRHEMEVSQRLLIGGRAVTWARRHWRRGTLGRREFARSCAGRALVLTEGLPRYSLRCGMCAASAAVEEASRALQADPTQCAGSAVTSAAVNGVVGGGPGPVTRCGTGK